MNFAISGSKGLIGEKLKERLEKEGHNCILEIDQRLGGNILNLNSTYINQNTQPVDIFIHCGAFCKINEAIKNPTLAHFNNAEGTFQALEFCRKNNIRKFIYFSSSRVLYPERTIYTATKLYGEELCKAYQRCYGIDYLIIRPSTVYSGNHHDFTERMISNFVINAMKNKEVTIYGNENKTLDFTYINDFVDGIMLLTNKWEKSKNEDYDISGGKETKVVDVVKILEKQLKKNIKIKWEPQEIEQPQSVNIDISKMQKFGFKPKVKIEDGIKQMIKFYKREGKRWITN